RWLDRPEDGMDTDPENEHAEPEEDDEDKMVSPLPPSIFDEAKGAKIPTPASAVACVEDAAATPGQNQGEDKDEDKNKDRGKKKGKDSGHNPALISTGDSATNPAPAVRKAPAGAALPPSNNADTTLNSA
ncbi:MAG TPA: hypothetical protein VF753_12685, partial [Terriglobales bacterium]